MMAHSSFPFTELMPPMDYFSNSLSNGLSGWEAFSIVEQFARMRVFEKLVAYCMAKYNENSELVLHVSSPLSAFLCQPAAL